ncbi:uncharacterized protein N7469_010345 [Penicillium citrinum]|uniref:NodB homology domain-containing protein n=1 Tax=Penicillium citrinum TaxID=5077 RepID=A0A9W9NKK0_PENCI|nr:uncharacterized protein N7469_010345 [Penicillium citrinum]KAJ5221458.1 hypothetical protein N7469_010345 [Penicillium citrinum]
MRSPFVLAIILSILSISSATTLQTRPRQSTSHVPVGTVINQCTVPGTIALTFDDGPWIYTHKLLDTLAEYDAVATFFLNGINKGSITFYPDVLHRAVAEGHQLGSHTWSHQSLDALDHSSIISQMTMLEDEFLQILGYFPFYMRLPYLVSNDAVLAAMAELGYYVIGVSIDTKDYENDDPGLIWKSFEKFRLELDVGGSIVLAHDVHMNTVEILVENMLKEIRSRGLKAVTIGECLGDPVENWYRSS